MANPKRRTSKHRKRIRRSHLALEPRAAAHCARCGAAKKPHCVCDACGHYGFQKGGEKSVSVLPREEY